MLPGRQASGVLLADDHAMVRAGLERLLTAAEGIEVVGVATDGAEAVRLALEGAEVRRYEMNPLQAGLHLLSDPNIAFVLFTIGFYGLLAEVWHPNFVTGILGGLSIVLALIGFGSLPLNVAGLLLLALRTALAMPVLLALHLGSVLALFLSMPYGKFVHGIYRTAALLRHAQEER